MLQKVKAIVLHSVKYGESGIIAQVYSDVYGRQSYIIQGVRKKGNKISPGFFQPLSILQIDAYFKENRELQRIKEVKPYSVLHHLHTDIKRSTIAFFIGEILYRTLRETESNHILFNYLENAIQILDIAEKGVENFHVIFLLQFTKFIGIYPKDNDEFNRYMFQKNIRLPDLLNYSLTDCDKISIDPHTRASLLDQLIIYYTDHLEGMGQIQSLKILREIFH